MRVRALPIPAQLASILGNHEDLLMRTFASERDDLATSNALLHSNGTHGQHASSAVPEQAHVPSEHNGHSIAAAASPTANPDLSSLSLRDRVNESANLADSRPHTEKERKHLDGEEQHPSSSGDLEQSRAQQVKSADIGHLQARLKAAAKEAGQAAQDTFQRAWMLGPHRVSTLSSCTLAKLLSTQQCIMQSGWLHRE